MAMGGLRFCQFKRLGWRYKLTATFFLLIFTISVVPSRPRIIAAWGFAHSNYIMQPLHQPEVGFFRRLLSNPGKLKWDGHWIYIDGLCGGCGKPLAPPGGVVLARLPSGLAIAFADKGSPGHLSMPVVASPKYIAASGISSLFAISFFGRVLSSYRKRLRLKRGKCASCNYWLFGNESGICPECGAQIPDVQRGMLRVAPHSDVNNSSPRLD
ncbi:hypothetical protein RAS2_08970 [Phycisphaerae bacterium RAS2]|nr:hypothetical protein RAS2_08970 [Phycisphaerae bacterium RAS2]